MRLFDSTDQNPSIWFGCEYDQISNALVQGEHHFGKLPLYVNKRKEKERIREEARKISSYIVG